MFQEQNFRLLTGSFLDQLLKQKQKFPLEKVILHTHYTKDFSLSILPSQPWMPCMSGSSRLKCDLSCVYGRD